MDSGDGDDENTKHKTKHFCSRSFPVCVEDLSRTGVVKVAAGTFHSLALTVYSQVCKQIQ